MMEMTAVTFATDPRYRVPSQEILSHRRTYHFYRTYVLSDFDAAILRDAYRELGPRGIRQIALWLGLQPDYVLNWLKEGS